MKRKQTQTTLFQCFRKSASEADAASAAADDTNRLNILTGKALKNVQMLKFREDAPLFSSEQ